MTTLVAWLSRSTWAVRGMLWHMSWICRDTHPQQLTFCITQRETVGSAGVDCAPLEEKSFMGSMGAKRATSLLGLSSTRMPSLVTSSRLPSFKTMPVTYSTGRTILVIQGTEANIENVEPMIPIRLIPPFVSPPRRKCRSECSPCSGGAGGDYDHQGCHQRCSE